MSPAAIALNETSPAPTAVHPLRNNLFLLQSSLPPPPHYSNPPLPLPPSSHIPAQLPQSLAHTQPIVPLAPASIQIYQI
ncbi:hypothetical protein VN97_g9381 [Penicillium thymicola]|uniref:Uncharacterized protein n=1 Tax=Penicillium thymicola TaxID=293382 RepID=A0AAI9TB05_PENTH|nr:hypothetical protein VN97_g9381 [Penicillium thymicola]